MRKWIHQDVEAPRAPGSAGEHEARRKEPSAPAPIVAQRERVMCPDGPGVLLDCNAPDVRRVRLDRSHPRHPGYCYPAADVQPIAELER